jgi:hypothetical protein
MSLFIVLCNDAHEPISGVWIFSMGELTSLDFSVQWFPSTKSFGEKQCQKSPIGKTETESFMLTKTSQFSRNR